MKKIVVLLVLMAFAFSTVNVIAQEAEVDESTQLIAQGELAQMLVRVLGLFRFLPASPSDAECFAVLMANGISPFGGWKADAPVAMTDLARVIILAIGEEASVEDPDDPDSWVEALQALGVPVDSVGQAVSSVTTPPSAASSGFLPLSTDPMQEQRVLANPDERQLQGDLGYTQSVPLTAREVRMVIKAVDPVPVPPQPATPN